MPARRHVELVPHALTIGAMFLGFSSILLSIQLRFDQAVMCVFGAMILDSMDGFVARLLKSQSSLGAQLDSLSDAISFGVAPAVACYIWAEPAVGRVAIAASFYTVACAAIRLARFNIQTNTAVFYGLNSPCAAALPLGVLWIAQAHPVVTSNALLYAIVLVGVQVLAATLMVTKIKYLSSKKIKVQYKLRLLVAFAVVLALILIDPPVVLTTFFAAYALSGPLWMLRRSSSPGEESPADAAVTPEESGQEHAQ